MQAVYFFVTRQNSLYKWTKRLVSRPVSYREPYTLYYSTAAICSAVARRRRAARVYRDHKSKLKMKFLWSYL